MDKVVRPAIGHHNLRGALWIVAAGLAYSLAMALVKMLGDNYSSPTQNFVRQAVGFIALLPFILRRPADAFVIRRPGLMIFRSAVSSLAIILAFNSFHLLGLAEANAISFTRVLFLVPLAALFLGERLTAQKLIATSLGFGGVIIILSPGSASALPFWPAAQGLLAAFLVSCSIISMKWMVRDHSELALLTWSTLLGMAFTAPFVGWSSLEWDAHDAMLLILMGVLGVIMQACYIRGMALGEAGIMAPIDYLRILFTSALGYVLFAELPLPGTYLGGALIIASTLYITLYARHRDRKQTRHNGK